MGDGPPRRRERWPADASDPLTRWELQFESEAYVRWCETQPCIYCGGGPCCCSHTGKTRGSGGWAEESAPACFDCHTREHAKGRETAAIMIGLTRAEIVRRVHESRRRWERDRPAWEARYESLED